MYMIADNNSYVAIIIIRYDEGNTSHVADINTYMRDST